MKKYILNLIFMIGVSIVTLAQSNFNYQAVLRDDNGAAMSNANITIQFDFIEDNTLGIVVYSESHDATTNEFGEFNTILGTGALVSGNFNDLDFKEHSYFLMTTVNGENMGTSEIQSVPVAQTALNVYWDRNVDYDIQFDDGSVVIGPGSADASGFTVRGTTGAAIPELVDFQTDTDMGTNDDILNLETGAGSSDNAQFIECRKGSDLKFAVDVSGKVKSGETGNSHMLPIAYGTINSSGTIIEGTTNFTVSTTSFIGEYVISINNISSADYTVIVTPDHTVGNMYVANYSVVSGGNTYIEIYDIIDNDYEAAEFSFVAFKK